MEAPGFFLFISTTITLVTAIAITLYVRYSVRRALHSKLEAELLRLEKHKIEGRLIIARQLATIGALAGGLTYHLNTTLRGLNELFKILRSTAGSNPTVTSLSKTISEQLSDAIAVSNRVCQATYPDRMQLSGVSAADIVTKVTKGLYNPNGVEMETTIACQDDFIFANVQLVQQVVENVLINALSASAEPGGKVHVKFSNPVPEKKTSSRGPEVAYIPYLQIKITDNGTGMAPELLEKVFMPQYGASAGAHTDARLGLPLCYAIMQMLQGDIAISSRLGEGTGVSLKFPLALEREKTQSLEIDRPLMPLQDLVPYLNDSLVGNA